MKLMKPNDIMIHYKNCQQTMKGFTIYSKEAGMKNITKNPNYLYLMLQTYNFQRLIRTALNKRIIGLLVPQYKIQYENILKILIF